MDYYIHAPWYRLINFVSEDRDEIVKAVVASNELYKHGVPVPKAKDIPNAGRLEVICQLPMGVNDNCILAEIDPGRIYFDVGAEAFDFVQRQLYVRDDLVIGGMHVFDAGLMGLGKWYFSGGIWKKMLSYGWEQHRDEIDAMLEHQNMMIEMALEDYEKRRREEK